MAKADEIKALVRCHAEGDDARSQAIAMQVAAQGARSGHGTLAQELRDLVDRAKAQSKAAGTAPRTVPLAQPRGELAGLLSVTYPKTRLVEMALNEKLAARLHRVIQEQRQRDRLRNHGFAPQRKLLLIGPPGTGKTMTASALAGELSLPLFTIQLDGVIAKFMGETAAKRRLVFDAVAATHGVYLFDEFDALDSQRGTGSDVGEIHRVLNSFLQFLEQSDSDSLIVGATDHVGLLDRAIASNSPRRRGLGDAIALGQNPPELYAAITAEATMRPEIQAPARRRFYSTAVTTDGRDRGQATSWSATIDALAAGRTFVPADKGLEYLDPAEQASQRLFVLSAGNVDPLERDHLSRSDLEPVHDPAQAWNALTVGACTDKVTISHPYWTTWSPLAPRGELAPSSPRWPAPAAQAGLRPLRPLCCRSMQGLPTSFGASTRAWFEGAFQTATPVQRLGWERIAAGEHALLLAPTGSGKTLAAFLWALDRLLQRPTDSAPGYRTIYLSPLKALAYDVDRNLRTPLAGITLAAERAGARLQPVRVDVRTGDTSQSDRRRFLRSPGDILITTPESLFLILGSKARETLAHVDTVIIDEIHALAPTKRGAHMALSLERLSAVTEHEPQRIGLSATQRPLDEIARFLGGDRPVAIVDTSEKPSLDLEIVYPPPEEQILPSPSTSLLRDEDARPQTSIWPAVYPRLVEQVRAHRTTIVFANNRRLVERIVQAVNEIAGEELVRPHHGSMSHPQRSETEEALKEGRVRGIVATSSLELGIDMGTVDLVLLVESPGSSARGLQRVGRSGHGVGQRSKGIIYPKFRGDLLEATVVARLMLEHLRTMSRPRQVPGCAAGRRGELVDGGCGAGDGGRAIGVPSSGVRVRPRSTCV